MLWIILSIVAAVIVIFLIIVALQPGEFTVTRSASIAALPTELFAILNDFHQWPAWSPWAELDPAMTNTYEGPPSGVGAIQRWTGNKRVGEGSTTITESRPSELIRIDLVMLKPFPASNKVEFKFAPKGNQTDVIWAMTGKKNFFMKGFAMFANMDRMIGNDFEKGLAKLKALAENNA